MSPSRRDFLTGSAALAGRLVPGEQAGPAPHRIGVVNVRNCFERDKYKRMAEALEDLGKLREDFAREVGDLQKRMNGLAEQMAGATPNGDLYVEKLRLRAHTEYDLKLLQEVARRKIRDRLADLESRVYGDIRRVVAQISRVQNLDLVLRADEPRLHEDDADANAGLRIAAREVLFHQEALDLTPQVLVRLNADWARAWTCTACKRKVADDKCQDCGAMRP